MTVSRKRFNRGLYSAAAAIALASLTQQAGCMEYKLGDKTAADVFGATALAQLAKAACAGDLPGMDSAIKAGAAVNGEGYEKATPLLWALSCDNVAGMEALLKAGANPNQDTGRFTPVFLAATRHNPEPLRLLLRYGGNANAVDRKSEKTALQEALSLGIHGFGWDNYNALIEKADINRADERGWTIATDAAALNQYDKVAALLESGYTYDLVDLARVVQNGHVDLDPQKSWQTKVRSMLEARGVRFPVPSRGAK